MWCDSQSLGAECGSGIPAEAGIAGASQQLSIINSDSATSPSTPPIPLSGFLTPLLCFFSSISFCLPPGPPPLSTFSALLPSLGASSSDQSPERKHLIGPAPLTVPGHAAGRLPAWDWLLTGHLTTLVQSALAKLRWVCTFPWRWEVS